jgi:hypothetical protein
LATPPKSVNSADGEACTAAPSTALVQRKAPVSALKAYTRPSWELATAMRLAPITVVVGRATTMGRPCDGPLMGAGYQGPGQVPPPVPRSLLCSTRSFETT